MMPDLLAWVSQSTALSLVVAALVIPALIGLYRAGAGLGADFAIRHRPHARLP